MIALAIAVKRDKSHAVIDEAVLSRRDAMSAAAPFANEARAQLEPWACERALLAFPGQRPGHGFKLAAHRFGKAAALDLPALRNFSPDLMLISAGFDAHVGDPLADLRLLEPDFDWITRNMRVFIASRNCAPPSPARNGAFQILPTPHSDSAPVPGKSGI